MCLSEAVPANNAMKRTRCNQNQNMRAKTKTPAIRHLLGALLDVLIVSGGP
jgi:hypothetical protein